MQKTFDQININYVSFQRYDFQLAVNICDAVREKGPTIHLTYGRFSSG